MGSPSEKTDEQCRAEPAGLDEIIERFEDAWQHGAQPAIDDFLPVEPIQRRAALVGLVRVDLERRFKAGEAVRVEQYLKLYAELAGDRDQAFALIAAECALRRRREPDLNIDEYLERFPQYREELPWQLQTLAPMSDLLAESPDGRWSHWITLSPQRAAVPAEKPLIPGYEILDVLGRGGMGVVYKARQVGLNRLVALKMILGGAHAQPEELARFRREAETLARLHHPNIVQIHDIGEHAGRPFFSLEYMDGGSLAQRFDGTPLPVRPAAEFIQTLARAVHAAHCCGIVHRDLKPGNILLPVASCQLPVASENHNSSFLATDNRQRATIPKIADFGLAKLLDDDASRTQSGQILGTPSYMAPEQALGWTQRIGPATDVYALGALLYQLLTGQVPFRGLTMLDTLEQVRLQEPVPPSRLQPKLPRDLETICLTCLQKPPVKRYVSAEALADDLQRFLRDEPIRARPTTTVERVLKWVRRRPAVAALVGVSGLAAMSLLVLLIGLLFYARLQLAHDEAERQQAIAEQERDEAARQRDRAEQLKAESDRLRVRAERLQYAADMNLAQRAWLSNQAPLMRQLMDRYRDGGTVGPDLHGFEWHYLSRLYQRELMSLHGHSGRVAGVACSADGRLLVSGSDDGTIKLWDAASGNEYRTLAGDGTAVAGLAWSLDGQRLAWCGSDPTVRLWDVATGKAVHFLQGHTAWVLAVALAPDGRQLASAGHDRQVKVWDAATGKLVRTLSGHAGSVRCLAYSPDGKYLASGSDDQAIIIWDAATGQEVRTLRGNGGAITGVAFSPDSRRLASAGWDATVRLWDVAAGQQVRKFIGHSASLWCVAFSPDGRRLASGGADRTVILWDCDGREPTCTYKGHSGAVFSVAFTPDGRRLISGAEDQLVKVWDVGAGPEQRVLQGHTGIILGVAFDPVGRHLASASMDGTVKLWEAATGQEVATLAANGGPVAGLAFSPDGRRLASGSEDRTVSIWDIDTRRPVQTLRGHAGWVRCLAYRPDGRQLATASADTTVKIWDLAGGRELRTLLGHTRMVTSVAYSPDGRWIASGSSDGTLRLWDAATGHAVRSSQGHAGPILSVKFRPDGRQLASASVDTTVILWDAASGQALHTFRGHTGPVTGLTFSPDGQRLASSSGDQAVKVWMTATGQEIMTFAGPVRFGRIECVTFSPDGRRLAAGNHGKTVTIWDADEPRPPAPDARK